MQVEPIPLEVAQLGRLLGQLLLCSARVLPVVLLCPWLSLRAGALVFPVTVGLALGFLPLVPSGVVSDLSGAGLLGMAVREVLLGSLFAVALALPFLALGWAGAWSDRLRGLPPGSEGTSALQHLYLWVGVVLFTALGGHVLALQALGETFVARPVGQLAADLDVAGAVAGVLELCGQALTIALLVAAPVALCLGALLSLLGYVERVWGGLLAGLVALPLRATAGLAVVLMGSAMLLPELPALFSHAIDQAGRLLRVL